MKIKTKNKKYWEIFHKVYENWDKLSKQSIKTRVSIADIIALNYKISYKVSADIANSVALSIAIGE